MTPHGSLFSTVTQSSRAGEDFFKLNSLGSMKVRATMKIAGVALESLTLVAGSLCVRPLNCSRSAQPVSVWRLLHESDCQEFHLP